MNISEIKSYEEQAIDVVVAVLNRAKETLGRRQTLKQLAASRDVFTPTAKVPLSTIKCPLVITSEKLIRNTIENKWKLTENLMYTLKYIGSSNDESSQYYYFEAIFSQPIPAFPIPQATASVFFRVEDMQIEVGRVPKMTFRVEGHHSDHDVRSVLLIPDWILAVIQMKIKLFRRIENMRTIKKYRNMVLMVVWYTDIVYYSELGYDLTQTYKVSTKNEYSLNIIQALKFSWGTAHTIRSYSFTEYTWDLLNLWINAMDIPEINSYEEQAVDTVVSILNAAKEALGERQTLKELAVSRKRISPQGKVVLTSVKCPLPTTSERLIRNTIEKKWKLTDTFMYIISYMGSTTDECSQYYYFEVVFSQPTALYPIPQATVSVFFRVEDKQIEPEKIRGVPKMTFRIEGNRWDHDVSHVLLTPEWLLATIQMKIKFFRRVEEILMF